MSKKKNMRLSRAFWFIYIAFFFTKLLIEKDIGTVNLGMKITFFLTIICSLFFNDKRIDD